MTIVELQESDEADWNNYVRASENGLPFHLAGWRSVLAKTYGYRTHFLMAREGERVTGVLPLFLVRSRLVGDRAMTLPGGLCAESPEAAQALVARGREVARQAGAEQLVLQDTRQVWLDEMQTASDHEHWLVDVRMEPDELWAAMDKDIRRQVRIARRNELSVEIDTDGERLGDFYHVLSHFVHQVGTPAFGREFLENVVEAFPGGFNIAVVYLDGQPIGGYFQLVMGNTMYGVWGATLREYLDLRPVYLAYWEMLDYACQNGYEWLDMGRSPAGSGASRFKKQWGGVSRPVYQQIAGIGDHGANGSVSSRVQSDGKFKQFMQIWPKLPFPVVQFLGPKLRRHVPFA